MLNLLREDWKQSTVLFYQCFDIWHLAVFLLEEVVEVAVLSLDQMKTMVQKRKECGGR